MFKSDQTLDFHNKQIEAVALGERCDNNSNAFIFTSPLGHVYTNICDNGIHCVKLYGDTSYDDIDWDTPVEFIRASSLMPSNNHVKQLKKWLATYFKKPLQCNDIKLNFCGLNEYGEFNSKIWMAILDTCPPGELISYSELATNAGYSSGASKVVGYAINKNPYMLVVGDHRVVKATGVIWTCDNSQRNKLRRLLVDYEISHTDRTVEEALMEVKERNSKAGKRSKSKTTRVKDEKGVTKSGSRKRKRKDESDPESEYDD